MNARQIQNIIVFSMIMNWSSLAHSAAPPRIDNNPFSRPPSAALDNGETVDTGFRESPVLIQLNATMVSEGHRLANVEGRILRPGDDFKGYTLRFVYEDRAVFERGPNRITVFVKPELDPEKDEHPID